MGVLKDLAPGTIFKMARAKGDGLDEQLQFIKLASGVLNVATMTVATIDEDEQVVVLGMLDTRKKGVITSRRR